MADKSRRVKGKIRGIWNFCLSLVLLLGLSACFNFTVPELTQEEKDAHYQRIHNLSEEFVNPLLVFIGASCQYRDGKGAWPELDKRKGEMSYFSDFKTLDKTDTQIISDILMQNQDIKWEITLNYFGGLPENYCSFDLKGFSADGKAMSSLKNQSISLEEIKAWETDPKLFRSRSMQYSLNLDFFLQLRKQLVVSETRTSDVGNEFIGAGLLAGLCILFDIDPSQCH
jgi:hypothetical protein